MRRKTHLNAEQIAGIYNEIVIYQESIRAISALCNKLIEGDKEVVIGLTVLANEQTPPPQPVSQPPIQIPFLGIILTPKDTPPQQMNEYEWLVDESDALRILNVIKNKYSQEIANLNKQLT